MRAAAPNITTRTSILDSPATLTWIQAQARISTPRYPPRSRQVLAVPTHAVSRRPTRQRQRHRHRHRRSGLERKPPRRHALPDWLRHLALHLHLPARHQPRLAALRGPRFHSRSGLSHRSGAAPPSRRRHPQREPGFQPAWHGSRKGSRARSTRHDERWPFGYGVDSCG